MPSVDAHERDKCPWKACSFGLPNAGPEPRPEAGAQRTLDGVGSSVWFGKALGSDDACWHAPQIMNMGFVGACPNSTLPASSNHSGCAAMCLSIVCRSRTLRSSGQST